MSYNPYGGAPGSQYGPPPAFRGYGANPPGMGAPPGLAAPGMSGPPPGMAPPGTQQPPTQQANVPPSFQPPPNMPNINFNARVIRLGTSTGPGENRSNAAPSSGSNRPGLGAERGQDYGRSHGRDAAPVLMPPTTEEKLRTLFLHEIPEGLGGDEGVKKLLNAAGKLRQWESLASVSGEHKGSKFGFAGFEDTESLAVAIKILHDQGVQVPTKKQTGTTERPVDDDDDESFEGIDKTKLQVLVDAASIAYAESYEESKADEVQSALEAAQAAVKQVLRELFYPSSATTKTDGEGDVTMGSTTGTGDNVEVVNIPLAQDDELSDIPAEMREVVAGEIAAFRDRSIKRDMERLKREEEMEERERLRNGPAHRSRLASPPPSSNMAGANNVPLGPRGAAVPNAPSGPRAQNGHRVNFLNGGTDHQYHQEDEDDTEASDEELYRRHQTKRNAEEEKLYIEAERKWANRERSRAAALEREKNRERQHDELQDQKQRDVLDKDKSWVDDREASRKVHPYYRDHAGWARKRAMDRQAEDARDDADRRQERQEQQRERAQMERAREMADSFLDRQADEMQERDKAEAAAPQPFTLSLGAAAQKNQASRTATQRRTVADIEGLLDDEAEETTTKRQLVPIQFDSSLSATASMTDEEISQAVRTLAKEIPTEKEGLWNWAIKWDFMDEAVIKDKLRPFVEKKIVEYLGVQEEMLVETVEEHLRKHGSAHTLVEELEGALDDEAEDLVKKLWRMVIFFTESEKRGLPS